VRISQIEEVHSMSIEQHTLQRATDERLQKGLEGLISGAYAIRVTRYSQDEVSAFVSNGDGKEYSVTLTAPRSFCGCGDAMFRGKTCKHSVALALYVIRTPEAKWATEMPAPDLTLAKVRRHEESAPF
jgi:uncharacterized Zn finger protein